MGSSVFRGSKRCQDFLQYVVGVALEGDAETLKERTLAIEVFGRDASAHLGEDSIVRVGAREVRKRLAQYYVTDGAHDAVRIDLPPGSYVPVFHCHQENGEKAAAIAEPVEAAPVAEPTVSAPAPPEVAPRHSKLPWAIVAAAVLMVTGAVAWRYFPAGPSEFRAFWQPAMDQNNPVTIVLPHPIVYHPSFHAWQLDQQRNGANRSPMQRAINLPPTALDGSDYVPVLDQYVGFGDTVAALRIGTMFAQQSHSTRVRLASRLEFNDMRDAPQVLIGAFTNRWTAEFSKSLRYTFQFDELKPAILDTTTGKKWVLSSKTDNGRSTEDFILISRMPHSPTGGFSVIAAGLTVYGTEEAGRILAEPASLGPILRKLPSNWASRNIQLLLHVEVVGDAPALPELVAFHTW